MKKDGMTGLKGMECFQI